MPREALQKHTIKFYEGEIKKLQEYYPEIGASIVVRNLVRKHLERLDSAADASDLQIEVKMED